MRHPREGSALPRRFVLGRLGNEFRAADVVIALGSVTVLMLRVVEISVANRRPIKADRLTVVMGALALTAFVVEWLYQGMTRSWYAVLADRAEATAARHRRVIAVATLAYALMIALGVPVTQKGPGHWIPYSAWFVGWNVVLGIAMRVLSRKRRMIPVGFNGNGDG